MLKKQIFFFYNPVKLIVLAFIILSGCRANETKITSSATTLNKLLCNGIERSYRLYIPEGYNNTKFVPLLIVLHGGLGNAEIMEKLTCKEFNRLADKYTFIVVYPNGIGRHWNDGRTQVKYKPHREKIDDVAFIATLIENLKKSYNIDTTRVYATGISNGAFMCFRLAIELSDRIAAIAPVAASLIVEYQNKAPSRPVPLLIINGVDDPFVPWNGGSIRGGLFGQRIIGTVLSTPDTVKKWSEYNICQSNPQIIHIPDLEPDDGCSVDLKVYSGEKKSSEVILYEIKGGGHTWPGGWQYLPKSFVGKTCRDINACEIIWEFFSRHQLLKD
ncbi:MAG TPA: PHB depolymerase family esterase [Victivallales bacterium]|nr:PHB depolymerase family esterase [Victivallales bacterium]